MITKRLLLYFATSWTALFLCFSPAIWIESAFHDNTRYFAKIGGPANAGCAADSEYYWLNAISRPVTAQIECQVTEHVRSPAALAPLRGLVITLIAIAATALAMILFAAGIGDMAALALSLAVFSLPGDANSALMTNIPNGLTLVVSLGAFMLTSRIGGVWPWHWRRRDAILAASALALLILAGLTYPVLACTFFWGSTVRLLADDDRPWRRDTLLLARDLIFFAVAMVGALLAAHLFVPSHWRIAPVGGIPAAYKMGFPLAAIPKHVQFLVAAALPMVLRLWFFNSAWHGGALALSALTAFILVQGGIKRRLGAEAMRLFLTGCLLILAIVPLDIAAMPQTSERTLLAAMGILVLSLALMLGRAARGFLAQANPLLPLIVPAGALALAWLGLCASSFEMAKTVWNINTEIMFARIELSHQAGLPRAIQIIRPIQTGFGYDGLRGELDEFNVDTYDDYINFMRVVFAGLSEAPVINACNAAAAGCVASSVPDGTVLLSVADYGQPICQLPGMVLIDFNVLVAAAGVADPARPVLSNTPYCAGAFSAEAPPPTTPRQNIYRAFSASPGPADFWETDDSKPVAAVLTFSEPTSFTSYSFYNGDSVGRMPVSWSVFGSVDGKTWQSLDSRTAQPAWSPFEHRTFSFSHTTANITYVKFVFTNCGPSHLLRIYGIHLHAAKMAGS
jgi:hypothetical protein